MLEEAYVLNKFLFDNKNLYGLNIGSYNDHRQAYWVSNIQDTCSSFQDIGSNVLRFGGECTC